MPALLLRGLLVLAVTFLAGALLTPAIWAPALVHQSGSILRPFFILSFAIFIAAVGYAVAQFRK